MYSIKTSKKSSKKSALVIGIVILCLLIAGGFYYKQRQNNIAPEPQTTKLDTPPVSDGGTDGSGKTPQPYESSDKTENPSLDGVINFKSVVNDMLTIRVTINQSISSGTCSLTLTRTTDKKQVLKSAEIVQNPSSTTCKGFDVPISELGSGTWSIVIEIVDGDKTGNISGEVTI